MAGKSFAGTMQEQLESGGKQFDKSGKTIVGRYRDGSMPAPNERAYGRAQMQIGTARDTAAKHGIPWDESKFMQDGEYNVNLGNLHMDDLTKYYGGDVRLARGAYHSGTGNVDKAIAKYGRQNFTQGLGPHGRDYVAKLDGNGTTQMAGTPNTPMVSARDVTQEKATPAEIAALAGDYQGVANPFDTAGVKTALGEVQTRTSLADQLLKQVTAQSAQIRQDQLQELDSTTAAKRAVYEHGKETTQALITAAQPLFQKRQQILDRRQEISRMNPFVAAVKGVIDPNYNSDALESEDNLTKERLQLLDDQYSYDYKLHGNLATLLTAESEDQNRLYNAQLSDLSEDMRLAVQSYQMGGAMLDAAMQPFQTDSALISAQTNARNAFLDQASDGQINEILSQIDQNGTGSVEVQGMTFSKQQVLGAQMNRQEQAYHMASMQLGIINQNQAMVDQAQERVLKTMNLSQVNEAIQNGGQFGGQQFDVVKLGVRAQQLREVNEGQAADAQLSSASGQWESMVKGYTQSTKGYAARLSSMLGTIPEEFNANFGNDGRRLVALSGQIKGLLDKGQREAALQLVMAAGPEIQAMQERRAKIIDASVDRWSGGNADLKVIGSAWANGSAVEPGAALRGLIYMSRNGVPAGMQFQGTSAKIFNAVTQQVRQWDAKQIGDDKLKGTSGDRDTALIQQIQSTLGRTFNSDMLTNLITQSPQIARNVMVNGKVHPFSMVSQEAVADAMNKGDQRGYQIVAQQMSLSDSEVREMFTQGSQGSLFKEFAKGRQGAEAQWGTWTERLKAAQTQSMFQFLDTHRTDAMPAAPSTMMKDLMNRGQFRDAARNGSLIQERGSMGGFVTGAAAGGGFGNAISTYVQRATQAHADYRAQTLDSITTKGNALRNQPLARTSMLLTATPGLSDEEEAYLLNAIKGVVPDMSTGAALGTIGDFGASQTAWASKQFQTIESQILNGKFEDPKAEALRRKVAPTWNQFKASTDKLTASPWYGGN